MIAAYIPVDDVDTICDRVGCADFDRADLSEAHYRTLVERIFQLEAQIDGARVAAAALERQLRAAGIDSARGPESTEQIAAHRSPL